jgi:hypothetical protein
MSKKYDLAVKVGSYTDNNGATKNRYKNIGALMTGNDGGEYILLEKTFNPAGVASDRESIMVSLFKPKDSNQSSHNEAKQDGYAQQPDVGTDEIPF